MALGGLIFAQMGLNGLWLFAILVILEVTFSFDNAVINSKVLAGMSQVWQKIFLTVGAIYIANCYCDDCERSRFYGGS